MITQGNAVTRADPFQLHYLALPHSMVFSRFLKFNSVQLKKLELVNYKHERENKASTTKRNVRQILFKKSNIVLILSCFTALSIHPMKSVCKETFKGYFSLHRQSSCLKYILVHAYFAENYAQDNILFLTQSNIYPVELSFSKSCSYMLVRPESSPFGACSSTPACQMLGIV